MWISNLKIAIASFLLLIPMSCMHFGDGHHSGFHYYAPPPQSPQSPAYYPGSGFMIDPAELMGAKQSSIDTLSYNPHQLI